MAAMKMQSCKMRMESFYVEIGFDPSNILGLYKILFSNLVKCFINSADSFIYQDKQCKCIIFVRISFMHEKILTLILN